MKSELRNELKSNLLADRLEEIILAVKPHLKVIGFGLVALFVAAIVYAVVHSRNEKVSASAWTELYFAANRPEKLNEVIQDFPSTSAGLWAQQKMADSHASRALEQVYVDRDLADKLLAEAADAYRSVLAKAQEPLLICRATYGLAQVLDSQGNSSEAAREYKKLLTLNGAHSEMIADAQRRIEFIESDAGRSFYEWFKNNRPTAPKPVGVPGNLDQLPSQPDMQFGLPPTPNTSAPPVSAPSSTEASAPLLNPDILMPPRDKPTASPPPSAPAATNPPPLELPLIEPKMDAAKAKTSEKSKDDRQVDEPKAKDSPAKEDGNSKETTKKKGNKNKKKPTEPSKDEPLTIPDAEPSTSDK